MFNRINALNLENRALREELKRSRRSTWIARIGAAILSIPVVYSIAEKFSDYTGKSPLDINVPAPVYLEPVPFNQKIQAPQPLIFDPSTGEYVLPKQDSVCNPDSIMTNPPYMQSPFNIPNPEPSFEKDSIPPVIITDPSKLPFPEKYPDIYYPDSDDKKPGSWIRNQKCEDKQTSVHRNYRAV